MSELTNVGTICNVEGTINKDAIGWYRKPPQNTNVYGNFFRRKIWNHYMWIDKKFICTFAIVKLDYAGLIFLDLYDIENNSEVHKSIRVPFSKGIMINNKVGSYAHYQNKSTYINVLRIEEYLNVLIKIDDIEIESTIYLQDESLNVLIPWEDGKFHYTSKQLPLKSLGIIKVNNHEYELNNSRAFIDYGRGVWEREKKWNWLTCYDKINGDEIGLNLGGKWTDNTGINENCIKINKVVYKLYDDIEFYKLDDNNWEIRSNNSNEINLKYRVNKSQDKLNNILIVKSSLKQYIGQLSGEININNRKIKINNTLAWLEDHFARW